MERIRSPLFFIIILGVWGFLIYSDTLDSTFHYDDYINIVDNPDVRWQGFSLESIKKLFVSELGRSFSYFTFALNYYLGGLNVRGYHYINIAIHILTAIGLFLFTRAVLDLPQIEKNLSKKGKEIAFIAALFWLSSPLQTQAVTYIVQRMAALAAMFYIYAIFFYLKGRLVSGRRRLLFHIIAFIFTLLAFASKENAYTLPLFFLLLEVIVIKRGDIAFLFKKRTITILSILAIVFLGILWSLYYTPFRVDIGSWLIYQIKIRFLTGMRVILFYMTQLLFPVPSRLSLEHDFQISRSFLDPPSTPIAFFAVLGLVFYALYSSRRNPLFSFFTLWFLGNLVIETFNPYLTLIFEHRLYLPSMGFFAVAAIGINEVASTERKRILSLAALFTILASFSINTYIRNDVWKDEHSLWSDVIEKSPNSVKGYIGLGAAYVRDESYNEALSVYLKAKEIEPRNPVVQYGLGVIYFNLKKYNEAVEEFSRLGSMGYIGIGNEPSISYYFSRIAKNYYGHGRVKEALGVLDRALSYDPAEPVLKEFKDKMEKGTITFEEIMRK